MAAEINAAIKSQCELDVNDSEQVDLHFLQWRDHCEDLIEKLEVVGQQLQDLYVTKDRPWAGGPKLVTPPDQKTKSSLCSVIKGVEYVPRRAHG